MTTEQFVSFCFSSVPVLFLFAKHPETAATFFGSWKQSIKITKKIGILIFSTLYFFSLFCLSHCSFVTLFQGNASSTSQNEDIFRLHSNNSSIYHNYQFDEGYICCREGLSCFQSVSLCLYFLVFSQKRVVFSI